MTTDPAYYYCGRFRESEEERAVQFACSVAGMYPPDATLTVTQDEYGDWLVVIPAEDYRR